MALARTPAKLIRYRIFTACGCAVLMSVSSVTLAARLHDEPQSLGLGAGVSIGDDSGTLFAGNGAGNGLSHRSSNTLSDIISGGCSDEVQAGRRENPQLNASQHGNDSCRLWVGLDETLVLGNGVDPEAIDFTAGSAAAATTLVLTPAQNEVPAPSTLWLLVAAVLGLLPLRRKLQIARE